MPKNPFLDEFTRQRVIRTMGKAVNEKDAYIECAQEFGRFVAMGEKSGLPVPVAFEAAREHFKSYGRIMMDIGEAISIEMVDLKKRPAPTQEDSKHD